MNRSRFRGAGIGNGASTFSDIPGNPLDNAALFPYLDGAPGYTFGNTTVDAAVLAHVSKLEVFGGNAGPVTFAADVASEGRVCVLVRATSLVGDVQVEQPDFTVAFAAGVTVIQPPGTTLSSAESADRSVSWLCQKDGVVRVLSAARWVGDDGYVLVDARNYGIYGDGGSYAAKVQAAIDALDAKFDGTAGMRCLVLPPGSMRFTSAITMKRVAIKGLMPNAGTKLFWDGPADATWFAAHPTNFNPSFFLMEGLNLRAGTSEPGVVLDFSTYTGPSPALDNFHRLRELHINNCTSHAIKLAGWINCHWEHLRFDHVGNGFCIHATVGSTQNLSSFVLDGFTMDHIRSTGKGHGFMCIDNTAGASNLGPVAVLNGRIEVNSSWATRAAFGSGGATRAVFTERLANASPQARSIGWNISNITYSDASGMADDALLCRDTSAATSDFSPSLIYSNVRTANLAATFSGQVGTRLAGFPVAALAGIGSLMGDSVRAIGFGSGSVLATSDTSPEGAISAARGSLMTVNGNAVSATAYVKEIGDWTSGGWARIETRYTQAPAYAATLTPAFNAGNDYAPAALTGALTMAAMSASGTYLPGMRFRCRFLQDATGGRAITWNAAWKLATLTAAGTANQRATVEFEYDGASWVQISSTGWY